MSSCVQDLHLQPCSAIIRINHHLEYFHLFLDYFFSQSCRLMIASAEKRASFFANARGYSVTLSRKELRSARMTRLFTIHINRVSRRQSGGEKRSYRGGPLHLACNACVVTAMCHSRRARAQSGLERASWIFIRGYCKINVGTEKPAVKEQQKEARNRVIPRLRLRFSPRLI